MITIQYNTGIKKLIVLKDGKRVGGCIGRIAERNYISLIERGVTVENL